MHLLSTRRPRYYTPSAWPTARRAAAALPAAAASESWCLSGHSSEVDTRCIPWGPLPALAEEKLKKRPCRWAKKPHSRSTMIWLEDPKSAWPMWAETELRRGG